MVMHLQKSFCIVLLMGLDAASSLSLSASERAYNLLLANAAKRKQAPALSPPPGALGPPAHLANLQVGSQFLSASRECAQTGDLVEFEIVKLAARPCCFQIGGLLSTAECDHLIAAADAAGMKQATTAGGDQRQGCGVAWLPVDNDDVAASVAAACEQLLLTPEAQAPSPHWADGAAFENMQVLKYGPGGEFKLHHDANEQVHRILTVLLYLNGVGETWFPLATTDAHQAVSAHNPPSRQAALAAAQGLRPGEDGLLVRPAKGDAVAFYNFCDDGQLDRLALHAGLPAPADKSVAALWFHIDRKAANEQLTPLTVAVSRGAKVLGETEE